MLVRPEKDPCSCTEIIIMEDFCSGLEYLFNPVTHTYFIILVPFAKMFRITL